jgi:hypothetical protein
MTSLRKTKWFSTDPREGEEYTERRYNSMAWTKQQKDAACSRVAEKVACGAGVREAMREVSKKTGVPYSTLRRWYYGRNENTQPQNENTLLNVAKRLGLEWISIDFRKADRDAICQGGKN